MHIFTFSFYNHACIETSCKITMGMQVYSCKKILIWYKEPAHWNSLGVWANQCAHHLARGIVLLMSTNMFWGLLIPFYNLHLILFNRSFISFIELLPWHIQSYQREELEPHLRRLYPEREWNIIPGLANKPWKKISNKYLREENNNMQVNPGGYKKKIILFS